MSILDHINPERKYNEGYEAGLKAGRGERYDIFTPSRSVIQHQNVEMQKIACRDHFPTDWPLSEVKRRLSYKMINHLSDIIEDHINVTDSPAEYERNIKVYEAHIEIGLRAMRNSEVE